MKLLFKPTLVPVGDQVVVGHTNFKNHYSAINRNMAWDTLAPYIRQATQKNVIRWIGQPLYDDLADKYQAGTTLSANQTLVLERLQDAIAHYTIYEAMPALNISLADMGVQQLNGSDGTSSPASQWAFKNARWQALTMADSTLDVVMNNLEAMSKTDTYWNLWKGSDAYKLGSSAYFRVSQELTNHINLQGNRRAFVALLPFLRRVEETTLKSMLCTGLFNLLTDKLKNCPYSESFSNGFDLGCFTVKQVDLLILIQRFVANKALQLAVPSMSVSIEAEGFRLLSQGDIFDERKPITNSFHLQQVNALMYAAEEAANTAKADITAYLYANADDFPDWKNSSCRQLTDSSNSGYFPPSGAVML